ncbi:flagellar hook-length control protein FliK [Chitinimonas sp. DQS-5]|uniref:Flagellar hook-length control protein FliK n=2 Tax=Parachitinimonas caeni TaxID=3031301 RepID=A0ABT7DX96_9NEIS|nr:flagellar hook-length control protein FliK [Parachitinimonas caeni]
MPAATSLLINALASSNVANGRNASKVADANGQSFSQILTRQTQPEKPAAKPAERAPESKTPIPAPPDAKPQMEEASATSAPPDQASAKPDADRGDAAKDAATQTTAVDANQAAVNPALAALIQQLLAQSADKSVTLNGDLGGQDKAGVELVVDADQASKRSLKLPVDGGGEPSSERQTLPLLTAEAANKAADGVGAQRGEGSHQGASAFELEMAKARVATPQMNTEPIRIHNADAAGHTKVVIPVSEPVGAPGWGESVGQKVVMMVGQGQQDVEMQLNPPNLGPLEVKLSLNQGDATVTFLSAHAPVREALQSALPKLQEMLSESGIALVNVQVGSDNASQQQQAAEQFQQQAHSGRRQVFGEAPPSISPPGWERVALGASVPGGVNLFV